MTGPDKVRTLEARIHILADKIVEQSSAFDKMQNKMFAIVGLLLTLGGLLTYDVFKIHFPRTVLEYIVFITALCFLGATVAIIGYHYQAKKTWSTPIGPIEEIKLDNAANYTEALEIIHTDYLIVTMTETETLTKEQKLSTVRCICLS